MTPEGKFQQKVLRKLKEIEGLYVFKKEAHAIRGIPDIIGCLNGKFFALELKKSLADTKKETGGIVLQKYNIEQIKKAGGFAILSCPETFTEDIKLLTAHCLQS